MFNMFFLVSNKFIAKIDKAAKMLMFGMNIYLLLWLCRVIYPTLGLYLPMIWRKCPVWNRHLEGKYPYLSTSCRADNAHLPSPYLPCWLTRQIAVFACLPCRAKIHIFWVTNQIAAFSYLPCRTKVDILFLWIILMR